MNTIKQRSSKNWMGVLEIYHQGNRRRISLDYQTMIVYKPKNYRMSQKFSQNFTQLENLKLQMPNLIQKECGNKIQVKRRTT